MAKKYPDHEPREILLDLIKVHEPKGKWFATAKDTGCLDVALGRAADGWADPATSTQTAVTDFVPYKPKP